MRGFACHACCHARGALLPHLFTLACLQPAAPAAPVSGVFSVPLSFELPRPGVTRRTTLWSSDFPPASPLRGLARHRLVCCGGEPGGDLSAEGRRRQGRQVTGRRARRDEVRTDCRARVLNLLSSVFCLLSPAASASLSVRFLRDPVLFQFLVQIAARGADHFRGLRDVPAVLPELADQEGPLGRLLELAQRAGILLIIRRRLPWLQAGPRRADPRRRRCRPAS